MKSCRRAEKAPRGRRTVPRWRLGRRREHRAGRAFTGRCREAAKGLSAGSAALPRRGFPAAGAAPRSAGCRAATSLPLPRALPRVRRDAPGRAGPGGGSRRPLALPRPGALPRAPGGESLPRYKPAAHPGPRRRVGGSSRPAEQGSWSRLRLARAPRRRRVWARSGRSGGPWGGDGRAGLNSVIWSSRST